MAYIEKTKTGKYRAHIDKRGVRESETFDREREAREWAVKREAEILNGLRGIFPRKTLAEVLDIYAQRVSAKKEGADKEILRLAAFKRDYPKLAAKVFCETTTADWAEWRDDRLKTVTGSTVVRDINLFSHVYHKCMHELGPYCDKSPLTNLERPKENPPRDQRWEWRQTKAVLRWLGYKTGRKPVTKTQEVAYFLLVCLRTAMRTQEALSLSDENTDLVARVAKVAHKMQYVTGKPRAVPMERQAVRLLERLSQWAREDGRPRYFTMTPKQVDGLWRKNRDTLAMADGGVRDLHVHDTRAEALTRLARKYDVLTLSRISGIKDLRMLNDRYYRERDEQVAARL